ncbi:MAG: glucose-1-phosphate cytidylyltransferase [Chloroflexi bacterium]|nr:MAG: glucose-1-phosphate cytidylyltransferase [Chloroflexota bacterium]
MKVAILAGGLGTRLSEETTVKPKPMVEIGGKPILWHIMKIYASHGFREFVIALGYKGEVIKDYFLNYHHYSHNLSIQLNTGGVLTHDAKGEDWTVHLLDTGYDTQTGGRVKQVAEFIGDEPFMLTYGDGVSNVNIPALLEFHRQNGKLATLTAVRPPARFGQLVFDGNQVIRFEEKPQIGEGWINGGFFVLEPKVASYIEGNSTYWEREPLEHLSAQGQLAAYRHNEFWQCMDTMRDVHLLEKLWQEGNAPWKTW